MVRSHTRFLPRRLAPLGAVVLLPFAVACGPKKPSVAIVPPAPPGAAIEATQLPPVSTADPVLSLIDASNGHFLAGQRELGLGHFDGAKLEFDRAVNVLLESPYGARTEPRIRDH